MFGENVGLAHEGEFPYIVSVRRANPNNRDTEKDHVCTGVLVSNKDVVTVEHCLREGNIYYVSWWMSYYEWTLIQNHERQYPQNEIVMLRVRSFLIRNKTA
jgi:hypothetical protein